MWTFSDCQYVGPTQLRRNAAKKQKLNGMKLQPMDWETYIEESAWLREYQRKLLFGPDWPKSPDELGEEKNAVIEPLEHEVPALDSDAQAAPIRSHDSESERRKAA